MIWFSSDHHFGHKNVIDLCYRPYKTVEEMDKKLVANWNRCVQNGDTIYYLGDFSLSTEALKRVLPKLNGYKILIPGNHDKCHVCHGIVSSQNKMKLYRDFGFHEIHQGGNTMVLGGNVVYLDHFPFADTPGDDDRFKEYKKKNIGDFWMIHGHVHNKWRVNKKQINVGVDMWNYSPVSIKEILKIIKEGE